MASVGWIAQSASAQRARVAADEVYRPRPFRREGLLARVAPFALPVVLGFLAIQGTPVAERNPPLLFGAGLLMVIALVAILVLPWERLPRIVEVIPPFANIMVVYLLREGSGGHWVVFAPLFLLPLFWLALYGSLAELLAGYVLVFALGITTSYMHGLNVDTLRFQFLALFIAPVVCLTTHSLVRRIHTQAAQLEALARTDGLTGILNRRAWDQELPQALVRARRSREPLCVALLDLDHFKRFNDTQGHQAGDELLRQAATAWHETLRASDLLARYGGEEFALLLPGCAAAGAVEVIERVRDVIPCEQTCSVGLACWDGAESVASLTGRADAALYAAKRAGRDRIEIA